MGNNPSCCKGDNKRPVDSVSKNDCLSFIKTLNAILGKKFRLPTEEEWTFAAKGGRRSQGYKYSGSHNKNSVAWFSASSSYPVATKQPNELGLYDMSGNVWELCENGTIKGGGWHSDQYSFTRRYEEELNPSFGKTIPNDKISSDIGFRLAMSVK